MLKTQRMRKVSIVGSKALMGAVINELYSMRILHIDDFAKGTTLCDEFGLDIGIPFEDAGQPSANLVKLRSVMSHLPKTKAMKSAESTSAISAVKGETAAALERLGNGIISLSESIKSADEERSRLLAKIKSLDAFSNSPIPLELFSGYSSLDAAVCYISAGSNGDVLRAVKSVSSKSRAYFWAHGKKTVAAFFIERGKKDAALKALSDFGCSEISVEPAKDFRGYARNALEKLNAELGAVSEKKEKASSELSKISEKWSGFLQKKERELLAESEKGQAPLRFAVTQSTFIAEGWVPQKYASELNSRLSKAAEGKIFVKEYDAEESAPVALDNPAPVKPFEFFMHLYALPKYCEADPTVFMFLTFPLFFGFMLGDIGYGIFILALFLALKKKFPSKDAQAMLTIMTFSAISSIAFGFVFGEFFGAEELFGRELPRLIHRVSEINEMILISVVIGLAQLNLGYMLGFYNKLKHHGFLHALFEKGSWIALEIGIALIAASSLGYAAIGAQAGIILSLIAVLMLFKGEGIKGLVELPSLLSNTLSYARLMAVGLASASLAIVVNTFAEEFMKMGGIYIFAAVIILVLGHAINIALGILGPFLHALRLHYVEFFTKFFEGGGKQYKPFGE